MSVESKFPVNYDFGKEWARVLRPLVKHPSVQAAIEQGVTQLIDAGESWHDAKYAPDKPPATYVRIHSYDQLLCEMDNLLLARLRAEDKLPEALLQLVEEDEGEYDNDRSDRLCAMQQRALDEHKRYEPMEQLEAYVPFSACHWWNPTFGLALARLAVPGETWRVRKGTKHTTVINADGTRVFDILFWALDGRLERHALAPAAENQVLTRRSAASWPLKCPLPCPRPRTPPASSRKRTRPLDLHTHRVNLPPFLS